MRVRLADTCGPWSWNGIQWSAGASVVEPFANPALCCRLRSPHRLVIAERRPGGDSLAVDVQPGRVRLTAGRLGVAPLYLAGNREILYGSWDVADLAKFASPTRIVNRVAVRLLTRRHRYSSDTLFEGITRLTERARAEFTSDGMRLSYPPDAPHVLAARRLAPHADPVEAFQDHLSAITDPVIETDGRQVALELSGGLDSANVACSAARHRREPLLSLGVLVDGRAGREQRGRRHLLTSALNLRDITVFASQYLPFDLDSARFSGPHDGDGEVYREAFDALRQHAVAEGVRVVLTGFGGDEMLALRLSERTRAPLDRPIPEWLTDRAVAALAELETNVAPVAPVAVPTLMASAARHPAYLRLGLWPIAPLAQPVMLRLGESLPVNWRANKRLFRERLTRAGFGPAVTAPHAPESFDDTMELALLRHAPRLLARMLTESILVDYRFVRPDSLTTILGRLRRGDSAPPLLYDMLAVETGLRSMTRHENNSPIIRMAT